LAAALAGTIQSRTCFTAIERGLSHQKDMPCTLTYLFDEDGKQLTWLRRPGWTPIILPRANTIDSDWNRSTLADSRSSAGGKSRHHRGEPPRAIPRSAPGCWDKPPARARLVPITRQGQEKPVGVFIAALNPYRQLDSFYGSFWTWSRARLPPASPTPRPMKKNESAPRAWPSWTARRLHSSAT
jgi:hypothetical protein